MKHTLLILGDSHVNIYKMCNLPKFFNCVNIIHTDSEDMNRNGKFIPYLMNTISVSGEIYLKHHIEQYKNVDYMMFIFGEPDVRIHFDKQINILNRQEDEVIETLCKNYIAKLIEIVPPNIKIIIRYILPQRVYSMFGSIYTPKGGIVDRVRYTNKMNLKLKELCELHHLLFFDNYEQPNLIAQDGSLKDEYVDSTTHYNDTSIYLLDNEISIFNDKIYNPAGNTPCKSN
jgi:hypothetical protein